MKVVWRPFTSPSTGLVAEVEDKVAASVSFVQELLHLRPRITEQELDPYSWVTYTKSYHVTYSLS